MTSNWPLTIALILLASALKVLAFPGTSPLWMLPVGFGIGMFITTLEN